MNHNDFILSPVSDILKNVVSASTGIGNGIETYPLFDYIMQSAFLKMTGAQEQKMKCISWELATHDYELRYIRFTQNRLGECSCYKEKSIIYKDIIEQIEKHSSTTFNTNQADKIKILRKTSSSINDTFLDSNLLIWAQKSFYEYRNIWSNVSYGYFFVDKNNMLAETANHSLKKIYENQLYKHRNRIAHNTQSYQQNLPTLKTLIKEDYIHENYFIYFSILILIDNIFMDLYRKYHEVINGEDIFL
ncbi:hypothetical protein [Thiothrix winogradskyi]|uniref:RiboL-PSP-HEPN domain-containing protein n=1 Tax=Thiothrix winogradskyi TaxID=96472 RepID=A0ABY3T2E9_9GAMM|nr:hypothetical protein [Thiothrix winogradskyi]UJS26008.1 hypothetical protein L2Y54_08165 [Thiothrix winogradskyi]